MVAFIRQDEAALDARRLPRLAQGRAGHDDRVGADVGDLGRQRDGLVEESGGRRRDLVDEVVSEGFGRGQRAARHADLRGQRHPHVAHQPRQPACPGVDPAQRFGESEAGARRGYCHVAVRRGRAG